MFPKFKLVYIILWEWGEEENNGLFVQLGLGFKLNTKIGLHTTHQPTHHTNFLKGSTPSRRIRICK